MCYRCSDTQSLDPISTPKNTKEEEEGKWNRLQILFLS